MKQLRLFGVAAALAACAQSTRAQQGAAERFAGVMAWQDSVRTASGYFVQTYLTAPASGFAARGAALLFVQWLSCDPVKLASEGGDGWSHTLRELITKSDMLVARTEKPGIAPSGGPRCDALGYDEELAAHRAALDALRRNPRVHPDSIFLLGASMGGTMVPLLARDGGIRGLIVWGSTGLSWLEHMAALDRRVLAFRGTPAAQVERLASAQDEVHRRLLVAREVPSEITKSDTALASAWTRILGAEDSGIYGRPFVFHQEAQSAGWVSAWSEVRAPVLVVNGEYDWIMGATEHRRIVELVNATSRGGATLETIRRMDHNFSIFASAAAAFRDEGGTPDAAAATVILEWLRRVRTAGAGD